MAKGKHTTVRLTEAGRARLDELAPLYSGQTGAMEEAVALLHRECFSEQYPPPVEPAIVGWVRGRTTDGREGWMPGVEGGRVLDSIDDDVDD